MKRGDYILIGSRLGRVRPKNLDSRTPILFCLNYFSTWHPTFIQNSLDFVYAKTVSGANNNA